MCKQSWYNKKGSLPATFCVKCSWILEIGCIWGPVRLPWQPKCQWEYKSWWVERLLQHQLSTSNSNLLLQTSKPFIKFSCNGKWKTVSIYLNSIEPGKASNTVICTTNATSLALDIFLLLASTVYEGGVGLWDERPVLHQLLTCHWIPTLRAMNA